jgi:hypothetical protein
MNAPERFSELWMDYLEGEISPEGQTELRGLLAADPALQKLAVDVYQLHRSLGYAATADVSAEAFVADTLKRITFSRTEFVPRVLERISADAPHKTARPSAWSGFHSMIRPLAAGVILGGLSVSVVWAYTSPVALSRVLSIRDLGGTDFVGQNGKIPRGFPLQAGIWGGDPADFIDPKRLDGVRDLPSLRDKSWLRFVSTAADKPGLRANSCDVFQIIDLRHVLATAQGIDTTLEFSARFADRNLPEAPETRVGCQIYFFRSSPESFTQNWPSHVSEAASFTANRIPIPRSTTEFLWTPVSVKVTPPPDAQFAVIQLTTQTLGGPEFAEKPLGNHFVDSLSLIIKTQPALPVQSVKKL